MTTLSRRTGLRAPEAKNKEKQPMSTTGGDNMWKEIGIVVGTIGGIIGLVKLVVAPLVKAHKQWREKHPPFRKTVLATLKHLEIGQRSSEDFNAALLRERLESAYVVYVMEMGWCPSSQKRRLNELFKFYESKGWGDLIDTKQKDAILALPERKEKRVEYEG